MRVSVVVPAAGLSRRFGGPNKLLQPWGKGTVVGAVVGALLSCGLPVIVVTGRDADLVAEAVTPAKAVYNERFAEGLGTSIACGVDACPDCDGFLVALGDMPELRPDVVQALLSSFNDAAAILAPVYEAEPDRPGHPVLFGSAYREELSCLEGDEGARSVMVANKDRIKLIPVIGGLDDIDEPAAS